MTGAGGRTPAQATRTGTADTGTAPATDTDPLVNRFPSVAFSYDVDASRLVMLYRDPANGKTVSQIPTEAALKQYKEAQEQEKATARAATLRVTVGGPEAGSREGASPQRNGVGGDGKPPATAGAPVPAHASSGAAVSVAQFSPATPHPAAASTGVARVNVVI